MLNFVFQLRLNEGSEAKSAAVKERSDLHEIFCIFDVHMEPKADLGNVA